MSPRGSSKTVRLLQTFEAVGRNASVTKAAEELGVTTSAISHQLRELTDILGEKLTEKAGRGISLTAIGSKLARELAEHFKKIEQSVIQAVSGETGRVRIAVCSTFGPGWMSPRFKDLLADFPDTEHQLVLKAGPPVLNDLDADIFITTQPGAPGFCSTPLLEEVLVAVGSPDLRLADPRMRLSRLITTQTAEGSIGIDWFEFVRQTRVPLDVSSPNIWVKCSHYVLALELARQSVGIALVPDFLAQTHLEGGALELFNKNSIQSGRQYHICVRQTRTDEPAILATVNWLKQQVSSGQIDLSQARLRHAK